MTVLHPHGYPQREHKAACGESPGRVSLLHAALDYAAAGLHVHPVMPRGKRPLRQCDMCRATRCTGPATCHHPACHGLLDATTDPARIRAWWERWHRANVGVATGPSGLAVVDLDGPAGVAAWRELIGARPAARTLTARTPSGGAHLWYAARPDRPLRNSASELAPGVDTRGVGGYVVAPPSIRRDGVYQWAPGVVELDALPPIPAWVLDALAPAPARRGPVHYGSPPARVAITGSGRRAAYVRAAVAGEVQRVMDATPGDKGGRGRNASLYGAAKSLGGLVGARLLDRAEAIAALATAAEAVGLGQREADRTITSGLTAGEAHPREIPA